MKAEKQVIFKAAELGILRSLPDLLLEPLKPGRLKNRFTKVQEIMDTELRKIYKINPSFFTDNKSEVEKYLDKLGVLMKEIDPKPHIAVMISFCLAFLERSNSKYPEKVYQYLNDIWEYYENDKNTELYQNIEWNAEKFIDGWNSLKEEYNG